MKTARPYQTAAHDAILRQLDQYNSTVVVLPTGLGKTVLAAKLITAWDKGNCLFLAHTRELITQAADKLGAELGYRPGIEMNVQGIDPDTIWQGGMAVVGSVQTMYGDRRLSKYARHPFGLIVVDECFPAGTLIDGKPIEDIREGDTVTAFDPGAGRTATRRVTRVFDNPAPAEMVAITAGGRRVTATKNHPFHTTGGWVNAGDIQVGDEVYGLFADVHSPARPAEVQVPPGRGHPEGAVLGRARVDRVEILKSGSDDGCGEVCPGGRVYNIEVEGEHTYIANGFAVHNCHHATSATYKKVVGYFQAINPNLKVVGITATPNRADGTALGLMFESVAYQMSINDAVDQGWLTPVVQEYVVVDSLEFDGVKTKKNEFGESDFNASQLEAVLTQEEVLHKMAVPTLDRVKDRPTLVFTATVRHAHELAAVLNRYKPNSAAAVDGGTAPEQRKELVADFQAGRLQFLCNCAVLTEGFDAPNCAAVVMGRPTKSLSLYTQMLGRGLRPLPGVVDGVPDPQDRRLAILTSDKPNSLVLDFVGNSNHKLASAYDVLGGRYDTETKELARREAARERKDVGEVMEQAASLLAVERQWKEREHIRASDVRFGAFAVDPFDADGPEVAGSDYVGPRRGTATDSQVRLLVNLGVPPRVAEGYSKRQAGAVIDSVAQTRCTVKQSATLRKHGIDPTGIGMDRASRIIDAIASNGWRRPEVLPE